MRIQIGNLIWVQINSANPWSIIIEVEGLHPKIKIESDPVNGNLNVNRSGIFIRGGVIEQLTSLIVNSITSDTNAHDLEKLLLAYKALQK